jgi:hypothetical protein
MEAHLDTAHPEAVEKASAQHAHEEAVAASPTLQAVEKTKSVVKTVLTGIAVAVGLGVLTWLNWPPYRKLRR